ncbi:MAG TPA: leucine--tRNA ligase, partial [Candidatus Moranbacteria bacterium]|nr:leucine--tRNA ligase [Candidatus Moranbacteria bacterium]
YKNGLAYKKKAKANWCESCKTVVANEQVVDGKCERCGGEIIQKDLDQWFFKITDFIEDFNGEDGKEFKGLINGLDKIDWPNSTKIAQKNWIGKSEGTTVSFEVKVSNENGISNNLKPKTYNLQPSIEVFTTRVDTIFGCTYVVLAPESKLVQDLKNRASNLEEIEKYILETKKKTDLERMENKEKTGIEMVGIKAINPFNNEEVPVYIADYVIATYGTGAVMAVPAHDERDFEFAKKYNLPIKKVIEPCFDQLTEPGKIKENEPFIERDAVTAIVKHWEKDEYIILKWKKVAWHTFITGGPEGEQSPEEGARMEILEETGYKNLKLAKELPMVHSRFYHVPKKVNRFAHFSVFYFQLENGEKQDISKDDQNNHDVLWISGDKIEKILTADSHKYIWKILNGSEEIYINDGVLSNSGEYNHLTSKEAREKMTAWFEENKLGERKINYRLRDWLVSRQRYWGAPIPIIYCDNCGEVPVPEKNLPVVLPTDVDFKPTGESPLAISKSFHDVACPVCGERARRESDTMDTFVCSSWYYLRFADPKNNQEFAAKENLEKWLPVDLYMGGAEHTVLHLLYARFFTKALAKYGYVKFDEPFLKLRHQGMIMAEDGRKMSKSLGNVVNPDDVVEGFGADALRIYEMFMGPIDEMKAWSMQNVNGPKNFLDKVWKYLEWEERFRDNEPGGSFEKWIKGETGETSKKMESSLHKTIKKVTEDIEDFKFNTAISSLMIFLGKIYEVKKNQFAPNDATTDLVVSDGIHVDDFKKFLILLSPFAPHMAEEIWSNLGHEKSIFLEKWPEFDEAMTKDEEINLVVQINGKMRDIIKVSADISEEEAKKIALESEKVKVYIEGKEIRKIIYIRGRLVSIVI